MKLCMDFKNLHRRLKKIFGWVQTIGGMIDEMQIRHFARDGVGKTIGALPICRKGN